MFPVADAVTATLLRTAFGVLSERRLAVRSAASGESTIVGLRLDDRRRGPDCPGKRKADE